MLQVKGQLILLQYEIIPFICLQHQLLRRGPRSRNVPLLGPIIIYVVGILLPLVLLEGPGGAGGIEGGVVVDRDW